ncbi:hypothetical protein AXF42_Ash008421 [Apostasia shenzhenica]|uniref:Uncharacterized protein n=1 Tax=Apostasia shenzhenica TaxID=1088818 RepID=A0A2I0AXT7_9ASPA|nr:hypothetical protein AXF42_Ash008421 [Apostasia shenzhenica]
MPTDSGPSIPTGQDLKWRYMWRVGPRRANTLLKETNIEPVIPEAFPEWAEIMDPWGSKMIAAVEMLKDLMPANILQYLLGSMLNKELAAINLKGNIEDSVSTLGRLISKY